MGVDGEVDEDGCGCVVSGGSLLSWKLLVVFSQSLSMSVLTAVRWNMGSQCSLSALAIAVGVVASSSLSVRMAPMLLVAPGIKRANLTMSCCRRWVPELCLSSLLLSCSSSSVSCWWARSLAWFRTLWKFGFTLALGSLAWIRLLMCGYAAAARSIRRMLSVSAARMNIIVHDNLSSTDSASGGASCCSVVATSHIACFSSSRRLSGLPGLVSAWSFSW